MVRSSGKGLEANKIIDYMHDGIELILKGLDGVMQDQTSVVAIRKLKNSLWKIKMRSLRKTKNEIMFLQDERKLELKRERNRKYYLRRKEALQVSSKTRYVKKGRIDQLLGKIMGNSERK